MRNKFIMVYQIRSPIRRHWSQRQTLVGLGLRGIRRGQVLRDTPEIRGMIRKVRHLVHVIDGPQGRLTPSIKKDIEVLERFNRRVTRTEQSAFWKRFADQIPNAIAKMEKISFENEGQNRFALVGTVRSSLEDFDQDEIAAFVLDYRQYTQNNDPISIGSLARIYEHVWINPGASGSFQEIRKRFNRSLDASSRLFFGKYEMSTRELVEIVVYGGLAHSNPEKAEIFEAWEKSGIMGFVWAVFFAAMRDLMRTLKELRFLNQAVLAFAPSTF